MKLLKLSNNLGGMRQSFMVDIPNMLEELKLSQTQTNFVVKSYKSVYRNSFETVSMDVQMQTMCKVMLERFNFKLKKANLSKLATYRYYYLLTYSVRINIIIICITHFFLQVCTCWIGFQY